MCSLIELKLVEIYNYMNLVSDKRWPSVDWSILKEEIASSNNYILGNTQLIYIKIVGNLEMKHNLYGF